MKMKRTKLFKLFSYDDEAKSDVYAPPYLQDTIGFPIHAKVRSSKYGNQDIET
jgi:hypothetical protein